MLYKHPSQELSPGLFFGIIPLPYSQAILEIILTSIEWLGELYQVMSAQKGLSMVVHFLQTIH